MAKSGSNPEQKKSRIKKSISVTVETLKPKENNEMSAEQLVVENFATLTNVLETLGKTLELLLQKTESMAYHIIATEEVLADLVATTGIDLASVNERIRTKIGGSTDMQIDPGMAIDVAAAIASPRAKQDRRQIPDTTQY